MAMLQTVTSCSSTMASLSRHNAANLSNPPASSSLRAEMFGAGIERLRVKQSALDVRRRRSPRINALFGLGVPELVVIAGVAALVFGPKKLPEIGKSLGKTVKSFQEAANEFQSELTTDKLEAQKNAESKPDPSTDPSPTKTKENAEV